MSLPQGCDTDSDHWVLRTDDCFHYYKVPLPADELLRKSDSSPMPEVDSPALEADGSPRALRMGPSVSPEAAHTDNVLSPECTGSTSTDSSTGHRCTDTDSEDETVQLRAAAAEARIEAASLRIQAAVSDGRAQGLGKRLLQQVTKHEKEVRSLLISVQQAEHDAILSRLRAVACDSLQSELGLVKQGLQSVTDAMHKAQLLRQQSRWLLDRATEKHHDTLERCNAERDVLRASLQAAGEAAARSREQHSADIAGHRRQLNVVAAELAEALGREAAEREGRREAERRLGRAERALVEQHARAAVVERTVGHLRGQLHAARRELHDTAARDLEQADQSFREGLAVAADIFDSLREAQSAVLQREGIMCAGLPSTQAPVLQRSSTSPLAVEPYDPAAGHPESCTFLVLECISNRIAAWVPRWWAPVCRAAAGSTWRVHDCWGKATSETYMYATHNPDGILGQGRITCLFDPMMQEVDALEASARNTQASSWDLIWFLHRVRVLKWLYEQMNQELKLDFDRMLELAVTTVHTSIQMWSILDPF
eukprot:TRINITY_DN16244_c0_g1_i13.p1 TRINITY_DN16244_c0_g1~~TRINITY_DN16244_c0_g1_i13.p1  ORF type:complete len:540 (+),score=122.06 TRINITY_DN16244_c0_g1_i13:74-1693(+)